VIIVSKKEIIEATELTIEATEIVELAEIVKMIEDKSKEIIDMEIEADITIDIVTIRTKMISQAALS
jgi:hypothetical protein